MSDIDGKYRHRRPRELASRSRSRSPSRRHEREHRTRSPRRRRHQSSRTAELPFNARELSKHDFEAFQPLFASYLDIQKGKYLEEMNEMEAKGRWKSFLGKWNRGELAEGWYDPSTFEKARSAEIPRSGQIPGQDEDAEEDASSSDGSVGPALPHQQGSARAGRSGPSIPSLSDLQVKRELNQEENEERREQLQFARKLDRKQQKEALDELVPRADAGTRERQLEKKKTLNEKMKSFRERSPGVDDVPESDLMGDRDGIEGYKKMKEDYEKKKNERELRREEELRARAAEREGRKAEYKEKEDRTMAMLKELARQRFG